MAPQSVKLCFMITSDIVVASQESDLPLSAVFSEMRFCLRGAWGGLWGRPEMVATVPNDRAMALRSFLALLIASPWFLFERWMAYRLPVWLYIPYNPPRLITLEIIYELQSWAVFPLAVFVVAGVLGGRQNFWRFLTLNNWATLVLLPFIMLIGIQDMMLGQSNLLVFLVTSAIAEMIILIAYCRLMKLSLDVAWWRAIGIMIVGFCTSMVWGEFLMSVFGLPAEPFLFAG